LSFEFDIAILLCDLRVRLDSPRLGPIDADRGSSQRPRFASCLASNGNGRPLHFCHGKSPAFGFSTRYLKKLTPFLEKIAADLQYIH
jgi:hypothetical protein